MQESDYKAVPEMRGNEQIGVTFERKVTMHIDVIKELHRITRELADMIAQKQDEKVNSALVDMYDAAGSALKRLNELAYDKFLDDTPPDAPPVPMR